MEQQPTGRLGFRQQVVSFPANYWVACFMEILERLAFFGVRAITPLYLVRSASENGLGLDYVQKGQIYTVWALLQCLIPMVSGGFTDRYGYRKSLCVAFVINILGYVLMAQSAPISIRLTEGGWGHAGFWVFLVAACLIGTGTAIFKPPAQGTVARGVSDATSSMGWGVFYWVVNIGGAIAPMGAAWLRAEIRWSWVFYGAAIVTALNFLPALLLYREPERNEPEGGRGREAGVLETFVESVTTVLRDGRLVAFLLVFSCFWLMFMQLWDLLPNFVDEWVDSSDVAGAFGWFSTGWVQESGQVKPEMIINIDAIAIIVLVIPVSWLIARLHKVVAMIVGMVIALVGFVGAGATSMGLLCCVMVFVFAIGEMACSPTFNAYVGLIAPPDKKALYMGYANIPFAIGWAGGNWLSGYLYESIASKYRLARMYLVDHLEMSADFASSAENFPNTRVMGTLARALEGGGAALQTQLQGAVAQVDVSALPVTEQTSAIESALDGVLGTVDPALVQRATQLLWDTHHPYLVWYYLGAIGLAGTLGMVLFYFLTGRTDRSSGPVAPSV
jgi:dipeptide/tripeptide permease